MTTEKKAESSMPDGSFDQKRAHHALKCVTKAKRNEDAKGKEATERKEQLTREKFKRYCQSANGLPAAILISGLGQALAAENASGDEGRKQLANDLADWLLCADGTSPYRHKGKGEKDKKAAHLLAAITDGDQRAYLWAQREALAWLKWLKLFATAESPAQDEKEKAANDG